MKIKYYDNQLTEGTSLWNEKLRGRLSNLDVSIHMWKNSTKIGPYFDGESCPVYWITGNGKTASAIMV